MCGATLATADLLGGGIEELVHKVGQCPAGCQLFADPRTIRISGVPSGPTRAAEPGTTEREHGTRLRMVGILHKCELDLGGLDHVNPL